MVTHTGIFTPADQCPSAPNHHLSSICASTDFTRAASEKLVLCLAWSRPSWLCKACIYIELKAAGNLSIFNKADFGQVNCCFQSHFLLVNKKFNYCFFFLRFFLEVYNEHCGLNCQENSFRDFPSVLLLTKGFHLIISCTGELICQPFCPARQGHPHRHNVNLDCTQTITKWLITYMWHYILIKLF